MCVSVRALSVIASEASFFNFHGGDFARGTLKRDLHIKIVAVSSVCVFVCFAIIRT